MEDNINQQEVLRLNRLFKFFADSRISWEKRAKEYEEFTFSDVDNTGTQLTSEQKAVLKDKYTPIITGNVTYAIVEQLVSFLTSQKPSITCIPVGSSSKDVAYVWREWIMATWYLSQGSRELALALWDSVITGNGFLIALTNDFFRFNEFNCNISYLPWNYVYLDPNAKRIDIEDGQAEVIAIPMLLSKATKIWDLTKKEQDLALASVDGVNGAITDDINIPAQSQIPNDKVIWSQDFSEKEKATVYILQDGSKSFTEPPKIKLDGGKEENGYIQSYKEVVIRRTLKLGNFIKSSQLTPYTRYPIIKFPFSWNRSPNKTYGIVHHIIDCQKTLNKCLALTIENAQVASNAGWLSPEGAVSDKAQFKRDVTTPGGNAEYTPDQNLPDGGRPIQKIPLPLSNAWYTLIDRIISLMEYITGLYSVIQGNPQGAPSTLGATTSFQNFGTQRIKMKSRSVESGLQSLFDSIIECLQANAPPENMITYINGTDEMIQIMTNIQAQIQQGQNGQDQVIPAERGQEIASMIKNEATGQVKMFLGDTKVGKYRIRASNSYDLPTVRAMALQVIQSLIGRASSDAMAVSIGEMALELLDIPEADRILKKTEVVNQLNGQIQELSKNTEELQKRNTWLEKELEIHIMKVKEAEITANIDMLTNRVETAVKSVEAGAKEIIKNQNNKQPERTNLRG